MKKIIKANPVNGNIMKLALYLVPSSQPVPGANTLSPLTDLL